MTISKPMGYQKIVDYWAGKGPKPMVEEATATLMQLAENVKFEKCNINNGVLDALFGKK
jgi:endoglucanase